MFINYRQADGSVILVEVTPEVAEAILDEERKEHNAANRRSYHGEVHLEALQYQGMDFADPEGPEEIIVRREQTEDLCGFLDTLTDAQLRRLSMKAEGMSMHKIAEAEGTTVNAVRDSLEAVRKKAGKYRKFF